MAMSYPGDERDERDEPGFRHEDDPVAEGRSPGLRPDGDRARDHRFEGSGELDLGDEDVRLPWLEGDDDDDYEETGGRTGQLLAFVLLGVVALALIVGAIWWTQRAHPDDNLVAAGETIPAPTTPYKTKPQNPGGEVVAGTGDTSFAVAEGQTRQVRMGNDAPAPTPASTPKGNGTASPSPSATPASGASTDMSGAGVQVGAYSNRESADKGWAKLSQQYDALSGMRYRIVEGRADIGMVYRLQAMPGDLGAANKLCATLKSSGLSCQVKR